MRYTRQSTAYAVSVIISVIMGTLISVLLTGTWPALVSAESGPEPAEPAEAAEAGSIPGRIAYIDRAGDLYTIKPNATDRRQLASGELLQTIAFQPAQSPGMNRSSYSWPVWSPDGSRLACFRMLANENGQNGELYIFDVSTSQVLNVHKEPSLQPIYAYWAPDGKHLAVLRSTSQTLVSRFMADCGVASAEHACRGHALLF